MMPGSNTLVMLPIHESCNDNNAILPKHRNLTTEEKWHAYLEFP
jgi:hypothetical protein